MISSEGIRLNEWGKDLNKNEYFLDYLSETLYHNGKKAPHSLYQAFLAKLEQLLSKQASLDYTEKRNLDL